MCAIENQHTKKSSPLTKDGTPPGSEKAEDEHRQESVGRVGKARARACMSVPRHAFTSWHDWGVFLLFGRCPSLPSLILNLHLRYRNMSGASFFAGAHHFDASNSTFIEAKTVSKLFAKSIRQASRRRWIYCRSTSTAIRRRRLSPLCQTRALGSPAVQKPSSNSRDISVPTQRMQFRRESSSCYMEWGVLERLRFA